MLVYKRHQICRELERWRLQTVAQLEGCCIDASADSVQNISNRGEKEMTNLEKIQRMSADELAEKIDECVPSCSTCPIEDLCNSYPLGNCEEKIKLWLESEASNQ